MTSQVMVVHFVNKEQIKLLEKEFKHWEQTVFLWPLADNEWLEEKWEVERPAWLDLMKETCNDK